MAPHRLSGLLREKMMCFMFHFPLMFTYMCNMHTPRRWSFLKSNYKFVINESSLRHLLLGVYIIFPIESHICIPYFLLLHPHIKGSQDFRALRAIGLQCTPDNERDRDSPFSHRCPIYIHTDLTAVFKTRLVDDKQSFKK